jgi:hypothetical protein
MKDDFKNIEGISEFIIHDIRKIRIREVYHKKGMDAA